MGLDEIFPVWLQSFLFTDTLTITRWFPHA